MKSSYVFGLRVDSDLELRGVPFPSNGAARSATLRSIDRSELDALWPKGEVSSLIDRRTPSGRLVMAVDAHPRVGYRISAPGFGMHIVSPDGTSIVSAVPAISAWRWQRLLFAQVVPLAATLQGLELFHASSVVQAGRAFAVIAGSGTGKSSIAAHLVARGAQYIADDVLALELDEGGVIAHPGPATASVHGFEWRSLGARADRVGIVIGRSDKLQLAVEPVQAAQRLDAIYFVERGPALTQFTIEDERPPDPAALLASSFISYLRTPAFLMGHLDACVRIARAVSTFRVRVPPQLGAAEVAAGIEQHREERGQDE